jgi:hypothetical protein
MKSAWKIIAESSPKGTSFLGTVPFVNGLRQVSAWFYLGVILLIPEALHYSVGLLLSTLLEWYRQG